MPFCDSCGEHRSDDEMTDDARDATEMSGAFVHSRLEMVRFCKDCAAARARVTTTGIWVFGALLAIGMVIFTVNVTIWLVGR